MRFSTKPWDDEIGWGNWGERLYDPRIGRWTSRDPIGEQGAMVARSAMSHRRPAASVRGESPDSIQQYGYVHNRPSQSVDPVGLQDCDRCGLDVTDRLSALLDQFDSRYKQLLPDEKLQVCKDMVSMAGWDIHYLAKAADLDAPWTGFEQCGCGTRSCVGTVQVRGACYYAAEVNYALWGRANRLCHDSLIVWLRTRTEVHPQGWRDAGVPVNLDADVASADAFSLEWAEDQVRGYRFWYYGIWHGRLFSDPNPVRRRPGTGSGCRVAWTRAGYAGSSTPVGCTVAGCSQCPSSHTDALFGHVASLQLKVP
ncbi:MAG: RHS repeat-associated core domain-containing protein [Phycisphaerae bacterium]